MAGSPCSPRDSQESSPTLHFKSISSSALSFRQTFAGKVMSLLFNMLSRLVITFLPRSKHLLSSWLQSQYAVILEPKKIKSELFPLFPHLFLMKWWDWPHVYGRKWRGTKKPLDEGEKGEWKSSLKTQYSENEDYGIQSHHFMANRWGNSVRLYFF